MVNARNSLGAFAMKVVVASCNPVKVRATEQAFAAQFPGEPLEIVTIDVDSGAGSQPMSDAATRQGARTRAANGHIAVPDADFAVGLEGGTEIVDGQLMAFAWMAIRSVNGHGSEARTVTLPLPPAIQTLVSAGIELGEANDRVFSTVNSKQGGGAFGLLSNGRYTRESVYAEALTIALIPFVHDLFPQSAQ